MSSNVQHSSESNEHYSPPCIVEPARLALGGGIDLDPFSCALANTIVRATRWFPGGSGIDGFATHWTGRTFVNPPGGKVGRNSSQELAWRHLVTSPLARPAIFVCFNLGFLQVSQGKGFALPLSFPICYPSSRIAYLTDRLPGPTPKQPDRKPSKRQLDDFAATGLCEGDSPPGASCVVFLPECGLSERDSIERFRRVFASLGHVVVPT